MWTEGGFDLGGKLFPRVAQVFWLSAFLVAVTLLAPNTPAEASHASNAKTLTQLSTLNRWWGAVGYIRAATGPINNPNSAVVGDALSADSCLVCTSGHSWAQVGVYRGNAGIPPCPGTDCIRNTTSTPRIYTENWSYACADDYNIYDHGNQPSSTNHAYWTYWTGVTSGPYCGVYMQQYRLAKTDSNGLPLQLLLVSISRSDPSMLVWTGLEMHNAGAEQNPGLNCFGATWTSPTCLGSTTNGIHLYALAYGWPLWTNSTDPTDGVRYIFGGTVSSFGCSGTLVPYKFASLADWYTFSAYNGC